MDRTRGDQEQRWIVISSELAVDQLQLILRDHIVDEILEPSKDSKEEAVNIMDLFTGFDYGGKGFSYGCGDSVRCRIFDQMMENKDIAKTLEANKRRILRYLFRFHL